ncbi:MAG: M56 family metallopeptidase, partial [Vicinamibacterales bacterium]
MSSFGLAFTSALVDFVGQGTLVALALLAALHTLGRRSAQVRYGLCLVALATLVALPVLTTASRFEVDDVRRRADVSDKPITVITDTGKGLTVDALIRSAAAPSVISTIQPWILPIWSLGVLLLSLRLVAGGLKVRALRRSIIAADDVLRDRVVSLASRIGLRTAVQVGTSTRADGPSVIGWLRPLILLPPATLLGVTTTQLDAVLAHELAHIRRHDYLVNIVQMVAETLLFYHPAVWWVSNRLRIERELCCDDEAVRVCGDATAYAR